MKKHLSNKRLDQFRKKKKIHKRKIAKKKLQLLLKTHLLKRKNEDKDIGHQDDEPNMLKSTALEAMEYSKKLYDKMQKYDDMEGEIDFPNWWQSKLTLAKDYLQKAYHYLDSEEKTDD